MINLESKKKGRKKDNPEPADKKKLWRRKDKVLLAFQTFPIIQ